MPLVGIQMYPIFCFLGLNSSRGRAIQKELRYCLKVFMKFFLNLLNLFQLSRCTEKLQMSNFLKLEFLQLVIQIMNIILRGYERVVRILQQLEIPGLGLNHWFINMHLKSTGCFKKCVNWHCDLSQQNLHF